MTDHTREPRLEIVEVTTEFADALLGRNRSKRPIREYKVEAYLADMLEGRWHLTEPLHVDWDGYLQTGQHRLLAAKRYLEKTGQPLPVLVLFDTDPAARDTVDTGMSQKFGDLLMVRGEPRYTMVAALALKLFKHHRGDRGQGSRKVSPTNNQLLDVLEQHPELRDLAERSKRWGNRGPLKGSIAGYLAWRFERCLPQLERYGTTGDDVDYFFDHLCEDVGHEEHHPVSVLRRTLLNAKKTSHGPGDKWLTAVTIKAWNRYVEGDDVKVLVYRVGGASPEEFPMPLGEVD